MYLNTDRQLLLYLRGEEGIRKSHVVKVLEIGFALLDQQKKLVICSPT